MRLACVVGCRRRTIQTSGLRHEPLSVHDLNCYLGVIKVGSKGGQATPLATEAEGMRFDFSGVHDLDLGVIKVGSKGGQATPLATEVEGVRFTFSGVHDLDLGVIKVGSKGGQATPLATEVEGVRFNFSGVHDLDGEGNVYFTDSRSLLP